MTNLPLSRQQALEYLKSMPQLDSDMNHYLESEAIMRLLAEKFGEDIEYWSMIGLLHDIDWSLTKSDWPNHGTEAIGLLKNLGFDDEFIVNVQSHAYGYDEIPVFKDKIRLTKIQRCLIASETLTGIIHAYALMRGKNISGMDVAGLKKKFKDKRFAANCNRELVKEIELAGLSLDEFFGLSIEAVKKIKDDVGLV